MRRRFWLAFIGCLGLLLFIGVLIRRDSPHSQGSGDYKGDGKEIVSASSERPVIAHTTADLKSPAITRRNRILDELTLEKKIIPELLAHAAERLRNNPPASLNRFCREEAIGLREGRLIALTHPDLMERIASEYALNPLHPRFERYFMMFMLGYLADSGRSNSKATLVQLANDQDSVTSERALFVLSPADRSGEFRDLYMRKGSGGSVQALKVLSYSADSGLVAFMNENASRSLDGSTLEFRVNECAKTALARYGLLMSPDWQPKLADIILKGTPYLEVDWAIEAARRNSFPDLAALIRKKLDITTDQMRTLHTRIQDSRDPGSTKVDFDQLYPSNGWLNGMPLYFDDLLVIQQEIAGKLTELEKARLHTFGYGCDPAQRLEELLSAGK
jgi:hypothetical protein